MIQYETGGILGKCLVVSLQETKGQNGCPALYKHTYLQIFKDILNANRLLEHSHMISIISKWHVFDLLL